MPSLGAVLGAGERGFGLAHAFGDALGRRAARGGLAHGEHRALDALHQLVIARAERGFVRFEAVEVGRDEQASRVARVAFAIGVEAGVQRLARAREARAAPR